jgi:hypothetical protein
MAARAPPCVPAGSPSTVNQNITIFQRAEILCQGMRAERLGLAARIIIISAMFSGVTSPTRRD